MKSLATKQEQLLQMHPQGQPPRPAAKLAEVPKGTPAQKSWHVNRQHVVDAVLEALSDEDADAPHLVGLVGDSGAGKTTAASEIVRSSGLRGAFPDGVLWLSVNAVAKERLPSLMLRLAREVHESIEGSVGPPPGASDDGAAYIKRRMDGGAARGGGRRGGGRRCLVVADNVWEQEVVSELLATGMWVLLTTRDETLAKSARGVAVGVDQLSQADAESVLRTAAELPPGARLPDEAVDLIHLCGHVAMDLAFVGRWSSVRGRQDRAAWSDAAAKVRLEIDRLGVDGEAPGAGAGAGARRRKAVLRAGFEDLAVGSDDERVPRLYLSLTVMPDGHAFTVADAAMMLHDRAPSAEDEASAAAVVETLERWTVVLSTEGGAYRMHDAHASFGRESLVDHGSVRRSALRRWVGAISSLDAVRSTDPFLLKARWLAVESVGGAGWSEARPYAAALAEMGDSDPSLRKSVGAVARFQVAQEDWDGARRSWRRLLEVEEKQLGADHPCVLNTLRSLADCASRLGNTDEAEGWYARERGTLPLVLAKIQRSHGGDRGREGGGDGLNDAGDLAYVASTMLTWAPDKQVEAEQLLRRSLEIQEAGAGRDDLEVAHTLQRLSECLRQAGRHGEAEELLRRCLEIREAKLGQEDVGVAYTLYNLGAAAREAGRLDEAEQCFRRCLRIRETKLGRGDLYVGHTLYNLGECLLRAGRAEEAEGSFRRCLEIQEANLGGEDEQVAGTLHKLASCARAAGRPEEAEVLFRRSLAVVEANEAGSEVVG